MEFKDIERTGRRVGRRLERLGKSVQRGSSDLVHRSSSRRKIGVAVGALGVVTVVGAVAAVGAVLAYRRLRRGERLPQLASGDEDGEGVVVRQSVTIRRSPQELYEHWRKLENLPSIMRHLKSVEERGAGRSHWEAHGPLGTVVEWDARITVDRPGERIGWRSTDDSTVPTEGSVIFAEAPGRDATRLVVQLTYHPPFGAVGEAVAKMFGEDPNRQIAEDLRRFKARMESAGAGAPTGTPRTAP